MSRLLSHQRNAETLDAKPFDIKQVTRNRYDATADVSGVRPLYLEENLKAPNG